MHTHLWRGERWSLRKLSMRWSLRTFCVIWTSLLLHRKTSHPWRNCALESHLEVASSATFTPRHPGLRVHSSAKNYRKIWENRQIIASFLCHIYSLVFDHFFLFQAGETTVRNVLEAQSGQKLENKEAKMDAPVGLAPLPPHEDPGTTSVSASSDSSVSKGLYLLLLMVSHVPFYLHLYASVFRRLRSCTCWIKWALSARIGNWINWILKVKFRCFRWYPDWFPILTQTHHKQGHRHQISIFGYHRTVCWVRSVSIKKRVCSFVVSPLITWG